MRRQGAGFGFVILLVVLAVVLLLASRAWKSTMPVAGQAIKPSAPASAKDDAAAEASSPRTVNADLKKVKRQADRHADEVRDAVSEAD